MKLSFSNQFVELMADVGADKTDVDSLSRGICESLHGAAAATLQPLQARSRKPWIQQRTLDLIDRRDTARKNGQRGVEISLNREIRKSAKADRTEWLDTMLSNGSWKAINSFRMNAGSPNIRCRKLANSAGELVESVQRAETFAEHLEKIQWAVRPMEDMAESGPIGPPICTADGDVTEEELEAAVRKLKHGKAAVEVPAEYLKAVLDGDLRKEGWLLSLMRLCWQTKTTPRSWHIAKVVLVYKKRQPG